MNNGHWIYKHTEAINIDLWIGFIYEITNNLTGRKYIGKKNFHSVTRKLKPGYKNRTKTVKESAWKKYTGSSTELNKDILLHSKDNFTFTILSLHETKGSLYYEEVYQQVTKDVLRANYYNKQIASVKFIPPHPTANELRARHR